MTKRKGSGKPQTKAARLAATTHARLAEPASSDQPPQSLPGTEAVIANEKPEGTPRIEPTKQKTEPEKKSWRLPYAGSFGRIAGWSAMIIGIVSGLIAFWPRTQVSATGLYDEHNPYSQTFTVVNNGFFPLKDVIIGIGFCTFETEKNESLTSLIITNNKCDGSMPNTRFNAERWHAKSIQKDEPLSVTLTDVIDMALPGHSPPKPPLEMTLQLLSKLKKADGILIISYIPALFPWRLESGFRFIAEEQPNGKLTWKQVPLSWHPSAIVHD